MWEALLDALYDSLIIFPFLLVIYIVLEIFEHNAAAKMKNEKILKGKLSPLLAGAVGLIPECGFSVVASSLYAQKYIALGTLFTVFIVTSDEAVPILLSDPDTVKYVLPILGVKLIFGVTAGFIINFIFRKKTVESGSPVSAPESHGCCCHEGDTKLKRYFLNPLGHALKILFFIFAVNIIMNTIIFYIGEEKLADFLIKSKYFQPFIAAFVGLIPNCASSVVLTEVFALGGLSFGSLIAGLSVNAGLGIIVLFKQNKNLKENILILVSLYILSVFVGTIISLFW